MSDNEQREEPRGLGWGYIIYQQIAGVIGAFALVAFLGNFVQVDWRGALRELVEAWDLYVRPAVALVFNLTVSAAVKALLKIEFEVPLVVRDYFSVGFVLIFSHVRMLRYAHRSYLERGKLKHPVGFLRYALNPGMLQHYVTDLFLWPFVVAKELGRFGKMSLWGIGLRLMMLAPLMYFLLLLAANFLLLDAAQ